MTVQGSSPSLGRSVNRLLAALLGSVAVIGAAPASALTLDFTVLSTNFNFPITLDYFEPNNSLVATAHYPSGTPRNFELIAPNGAHSPFSTLSGIADEVRMASVRSTARGGFAGTGFAAGTVFAGNGVDGQIVMIAPDGSTAPTPFVDLPGANNGQLRGALYVDRTGVWDGDLIAVTRLGQVWRIDGAGVATSVADVGPTVSFDSVLTVPNDPGRYGDLAGKIIAGQQSGQTLWAFDTAGGAQSWSTPSVNLEDLDLIAANENLYAVSFGAGQTIGAEASQLAGNIGDILVTSEGGPTAFSLLTWDFGADAPSFEAVALAPGSATPTTVQGATFAPAGLAQIQTTDPLPDFLLTPAGGTTQEVAAVQGAPNESAAVQYRYNIENANSSNSGLERDDGGVAYLFEDDQHRLSLMFHLDRAGSATGGDVCIGASISGLDSSSIVLIADDAADPRTWTPAAGSGQFCWNWAAGQTDGVVLTLPRPDPTSEWSITFTMLSGSGLSNFVFLTGPGGASSVDLGAGFSFTIASAFAEDVPEPAFAPPLLALLGFLAYRRWRRSGANMAG